MNNGRIPFLPPAPAPIGYNDSENAIKRRLCGEMPPPPVNANPAFAQVILQACQGNADARFSSATQMREALEALALGGGGDQPRPRKKGVALAAVLAAVVLAAGVTTAVLYLRNNSQPAVKPDTQPVDVQQPVQDLSGVSEAKAALGRVQAAKPGAYASRWEGQLQELYDRIAERGDFSYDLGKDPMYRQAREQYQTAGRLAMQDTMGQAAALTGGYGSSYGQQTGQQTYNAYLQQLNEIVPELYAQAREQWQSGEAALYDRYQLLSSREQSDYARYRDQMSDYYAELDDARSAYASAVKLANDNYWSSLEYQADREDAANAQYWKQLAYADKQAAAAEAAAKAAQNAAAKSTGTAGSRKQKTASSKAGGRSTGVKKTRSSAWTSGQAELN